MPVECLLRTRHRLDTVDPAVVQVKVPALWWWLSVGAIRMKWRTLCGGAALCKEVLCILSV